jgi:hypothetical protein
MTVNTSIITSGVDGDYTGVSAWEAGTDYDLVTSGNIEIGLVSGIVFESQAFIQAAITNASFHRALTYYPGTKHTGTSGTGARMLKSGADANILISVNEAYFAISGLELAGSGNALVIAAGDVGNASGLTVANSLVYDMEINPTFSTDGLRTNVANTTMHLYNNVFWNFYESAINIANASQIEFDIHNNTIHAVNVLGGADRGGIRLQTAINPSTVNNNLITLVYGQPAFAGATSGNIVGSGNATFDDSAFDTSTPVTSVINISGADIYTSDNEVTGYDFSIKDSDAPIVNSGVTIDLV